MSEGPEWLLYRGPFGEARRLVEIERFSLARGRDYARHADLQRENLLAELRPLYPGTPAELLELAVDDAIAGPDPRY